MDNLRRIVRSNLVKILNEQLSDYLLEYIFDLIKVMPMKYKLQTKYGDSFKLYPDGISTAINNSMITRFYLKILKNKGKTTTIMPGPKLNPATYDKLNELIKIIDNYHKPVEQKDSTSILNMPDNERLELNNRLFRAQCFQMMNLLLYEEYFDVYPLRRDPHEIINDLKLPQNEEEFLQLFEEWNNKEGEVRLLLFRADSVDIIRAIENY